MRYKAMFAVGFAAGYVFGAKAGRQRYEQLRRLAHSVSDNPAVKQTTDRMQAQAMQFGNQARRRMQERAEAVSHDLMGKVSSRFGHHEINLDSERTYANGAMT